MSQANLCLVQEVGTQRRDRINERRDLEVAQLRIEHVMSLREP